MRTKLDEPAQQRDHTLPPRRLPAPSIWRRGQGQAISRTAPELAPRPGSPPSCTGGWKPALRDFSRYGGPTRAHSGSEAWAGLPGKPRGRRSVGDIARSRPDLWLAPAKPRLEQNPAKRYPNDYPGGILAEFGLAETPHKPLIYF